MQTERERDLYRRLLDLAHGEAVGPLLEEALQLALEVSGAEQAYLRLNRPDDDAPHPASIAHHCSSEELDTIEARISQGIVQEAMLTGRTVQTPAALLDARFRDRASVRSNAIEAVLCAPIGGPPAIGVLYLQGRRDAGPFSPEILALVEAFARHVGLFAHRLLEREAQEGAADPTGPWRQRLRCEELIGRSPALANMLRTVSAVAPLDGVDVLLTGESGTGKTAVARTLVANSPRAAGPFVELNCAAIPEALFEAEIFGAARGAHSMAQADAPGKIQAAHGGTLFLDEVAELTLASQAKLLQFLQSRTFFRLGSVEPVVADVRVIAATNADLAARVAAGAFRSDLMYRLHVMEVRVPALAERAEDLPLLTRHFLARSAERNRLPAREASPDALHAVTYAAWPGNIRQLEHACQAALVRAEADGAATVTARHFFPEQAQDAGARSYQDATREFQVRLVKEALTANDWNVSQAARQLGLARSHLYNLIQGFGITRPGA
ncbi:MAG: sigma-54-dependent Fis family transcriptional regulator [Deltaproteobacteria bacterium]|nr:sigma-54-dependent Fis family transcriptional regulator [Deltaproteobacteria bacterium]